MPKKQSVNGLIGDKKSSTEMAQEKKGGAHQFNSCMQVKVLISFYSWWCCHQGLLHTSSQASFANHQQAAAEGPRAGWLLCSWMCGHGGQRKQYRSVCGSPRYATAKFRRGSGSQ